MSQKSSLNNEIKIGTNLNRQPDGRFDCSGTLIPIFQSELVELPPNNKFVLEESKGCRYLLQAITSFWKAGDFWPKQGRNKDIKK